MAKSKNKKIQRILADSFKKINLVFLMAMGGLIVLFLGLGVFLFMPKEPASIYVFPENPKQGDTVFIRVKTSANEITGNLGQERLIFFRKGNLNEWVSFLGIDADQKIGDYKIYADTSDAEHLTKEIKISLADFSSPETPATPLAAQNGITNEKAVDNIRSNDNPALQKVLTNFTPQPYFTGPFSFPLSTMKTSGFAFGKFVGLAKYKLQHLGVDLRAPKETNIFSVNNGKVVAVLNLSNYGKTVIIDHGLDIFSMYLHLNEFKVANGQIVQRGQLIGLSGDTGYSSAPHLHFSIRVGNSRVDPVAFIQTTKKLNDNFFLADLMNAILNIINGK